MKGLVDCNAARIVRLTPLSRDHHGPRAILHAVERIIDSYDAQRDRAQHDLTIAQNQLRDYEARLGTAFQHETYLTELTELRDRLKTALSNLAEHSAEIPALTERMKTLKASQSIEAAPEYHPQRLTATVAEPVTTRLFEKIKEMPIPEELSLVPVTMAMSSPAPGSVTPFKTMQPSLFDAPLSRPDKPKPSRRQPDSRPAPALAEQLRLW